MAYDADYDWPETRFERFRRWFLRFVALLALVGAGYGVYTIVQEATEAEPAPAAELNAELQQVAASLNALSGRLQALSGRRSAQKAQAALREAKADQQAAVAELRRRRAAGPVRADGELGRALDATGEYLRVVGRVLKAPTDQLLARIGDRAQKARKAFAALPDDAGAGRNIKGVSRLRAYAQARRG